MEESVNTQKEQKVLHCFYCGNKTKMDMVGMHVYHWEVDDGSYRGYDKYRMFSCPVCGKVTFHLAYWEEGMYDRDNQMFEEESIVFPVNSMDSKAMPPKIKDTFEAALKTRNINNDICLIALRKTLELICIDKGALKWGLKDKIEELAQNGILPEPLKEASSLAKILGDSAAHDKGLDVNNQDINSMIDFVEYIIEYLYILPFKLTRFKKRLKSLDGSL